MRSSKSRSRSKSNRNRSVGNIVNRVFDSSGPDGKVRGTPQQIIDKYLQLARDAQLSNDRVATENFQQHAEHYIRMLGEAQREAQKEADARREWQEAQNRDRQQQQQNRDRDETRSGQPTEGGSESVTQATTPAPAPTTDQEPRPAPAPDVAAPDNSALEVVGDAEQEVSSGLVETPEDAPAKPKRRRSRKPKPADSEDTATAAEGSEPGTGEDGQPQAAE